MSWSDLDKELNGSKLSGRFVKFDSKLSTRIRILDNDPHTTFVHKVKGQPTAQEPEGIFRSIAATPSLDDDYIQQVNGKRFPAVAQYSMRVYEYKRDDKGKFTADGELKILQGGPAIFKQLRTIMEENGGEGSLKNFDVIISKSGEKRDTEYLVSASPLAMDVDVDALLTKLGQDSDLLWENVFPIMTAEGQKKILAEAKIDITYDPVAELEAKISYEQAILNTIPFGKYKGKTISEVLVMDASWVEWAGENVTSNDSVAAACRVAFRHVNTVASGDAPQSQLPPAATSAPAKSAAAPKAAPAKAAKPPVDAERAGLVNSVSSKLENLDAVQIVAKIKEASATGQTKLKDLSVDELKNLDASL